MTFMELVDIEPSVRVCDIIQLFLMGCDDKIYLNLFSSKDVHADDYILKDERIISEKWEPYYECKVKWIEEECSGERGFAGLTLHI